EPQCRVGDRREPREYRVGLPLFPPLQGRLQQRCPVLEQPVETGLGRAKPGGYGLDRDCCRPAFRQDRQRGSGPVIAGEARGTRHRPPPWTKFCTVPYIIILYGAVQNWR